MKHYPILPDIRSECPPQIWMGQGLKQVFLELTPFCNSRCPGCLNESFIDDFVSRTVKTRYQAPVLSVDNWVTVLSKLPESLTNVVLTGGEPTLYPGFLSLLEEIETRGHKSVIFTNGRWPKPNNLLRFLQNCQKFKGFLISLHGISAGTHEAFTGIKGSFDETIRNIRRAVASGLNVTLSIVITRENIHELTQFPAFATDLGVEAISYNRYIYTNERASILGDILSVPTPIQLKLAVNQIEASREQYLGKVEIGYGPTPQCFEESNAHGCSAGEASIVIDPWGNIKPCLHVDLICGNIVQQDFEDIWSSEKLNKWRNLSLAACSTCTAFSACGGGCKAMAMSSGGSRDPLMTQQIASNIIAISEIMVYQ